VVRRIQKVRKFNRVQKLILGVFLVALLFTGYQVFRTVRQTIAWREQRNETIQGWMRIDNLARAHNVPPLALYEALGLPPDSSDKRTLFEIARSQNRSMEEIKTLLQNAIIKEQLRNSSSVAGGDQRE
jgi:hypothetical protein